MNDRLKDFLEVNAKAFSQSFGKINKIYIAFIVILIRSFFLNYRFTGIFAGTYLGGLLYYFIDAALLCFVAQALRSLVVFGNLGKKSIGNSLSNFWQPIILPLFFYYLIQDVIRMVGGGMTILLILVFEFLMSAMLEEIYINDTRGFQALSKSAKFVCDNILTYGLFALIFVLVEVNLIYKLIYGLGFGPRRILFIGLFALVQTFFYLIRGHLFKELNDHSYRQRKFMRG